MRSSKITRGLQRILGYGNLYTVGGYVVIHVNDLNRAVTWYCDKLGLSVLPENSYSGEVHLGYQQSDENVMIVLFPIPEGKSFFSNRHPILFTKKLDAVHAEFAAFEIQTGPIQSDSGGNRFFCFRDLEGNDIEVCVEP